MKIVFALRGKSNTGKSPTIRTVVEMLNAKHPDVSIEHQRATKKDIRAILTVNGLKIGVESQGGPKLNESLDLFMRTGCDAIICVTKTSGASVDAVNALQGVEVHWLEQREQSKPNEQVLRSLIMAREIVERVEESIASPEAVPARSLAASA